MKNHIKLSDQYKLSVIISLFKKLIFNNYQLNKILMNTLLFSIMQNLLNYENLVVSQLWTKRHFDRNSKIKPTFFIVRKLS